MRKPMGNGEGWGTELWEMPNLKKQKGAPFMHRGVVRKKCEQRVTETNRERGWSTVSNNQKAKEDEDEVWE